MEFTTISAAKKATGLSYLGSINSSAKIVKAEKYNEMTYVLYLSPARSSGYEVCKGRTPECTKLCLHESGRNRMNTKEQLINKARLKKTKLFFEERDFFVGWLIAEIKNAKAKADKKGHAFSVRLNGTSDLSPEDFKLKIEGKEQNILELLPDVQFYDYTKVESRIELSEYYDNYDLTFSFSGQNKDACHTALENNVRVAVVFTKIPETYWGHKVIDADLYDMRYKDPKNVICGLKYKKVRNQLPENTSFVIQTL